MKNVMNNKMFDSDSRILLGFKVLFFKLLLSVLLIVLLTGREAVAQDWIYTVKPGDTIWDLTEKYLIDMRYWRRLQQLNKVVNPYRMPSGRSLRMPAAWLRMDSVGATVLKTRGSPQVISGKGKTAVLMPGMTVTTGDIIQTGNTDNVSLQFEDGSRLLLESESYLSLEEISTFKPMKINRNRVRLKHGSVEARVPVPQQKTGTRFNIKTRSASLAVRGTVFRVNSPLLQTLTRTEVLTGEVVANSAGRSRVLTANTGTIIEQGKAPRTPRELLPAPDLSALSKRVRQMPVLFHLPLSEQAVGYRMQIAHDDQFDALLFDGNSLASLLKGPTLADGDYVMRVRAIDKFGLQGEDSVHRFTVDARPPSPLVLAPVMGAVVRESRPEFRWVRTKPTDKYRFQLSQEKDFSRPLIDINDLAADHYTPTTALASGHYYWRLGIITETGEQAIEQTVEQAVEQGPWTNPIQFELRLDPPPSYWSILAVPAILLLAL